MGACFTVNLELTFLDEAAAVKAMQEYIHTANADFGLEKHKKRSVGREIVRKYWTVYYLQKIFGKNIRGKNAENDLIIDSLYTEMVFFCGFLIAPIGAINIRRYTCDDRNAYIYV